MPGWRRWGRAERAGGEGRAGRAWAPQAALGFGSCLNWGAAVLSSCSPGAPSSLAASPGPEAPVSPAAVPPASLSWIWGTRGHPLWKASTEPPLVPSAHLSLPPFLRSAGCQEERGSAASAEGWARAEGGQSPGGPLNSDDTPAPGLLQGRC